MYAIYSNLRACVSQMDSSGSSDAAIALYVLTHHEDVPGMCIGDLAEACGTSAPTISRFCRRVNGSDFKTFKDEMEEYNAWLRRDPSASRRGQRVDTAWYFDSLESSIEETRELLTGPILEQAVDWLIEARGVYLYGSSFSNIRAEEASEKLNRINRSSFSFNTARSQLASTKLIHPEDAVVLLSFSGINQHTARIYTQAKKRGCRIIWVSSNRDLACRQDPREMLLPVSDVSLSEYSTSLIEGISLQCAVDCLFMSYANRLRSR